MAKTCNSCNTETNIVTMSGANFELNEARHERREKRLVIALIISVILLFASNCVWLYAWCQYDYTGEEITVDATQDGEGVNILGGGNINYGAESTDSSTQTNTN